MIHGIISVGGLYAFIGVSALIDIANKLISFIH